MKDNRQQVAGGRAGAGLIEVLPVSEALGAEIRGVDLSQALDPETVAAIKAAWAEHLVLLFRDQQLTEEQHIRFSGYLGELIVPNVSGLTARENPEILLVSNMDSDGELSDKSLGNAEALWHSDMTYMEDPPAGSCLYGRNIPPEGGNTCFCNMYSACEELDPDLRERVSGMRAIHDASRNSAGGLRDGYKPESDPRKTPGPQHPIVRTHPVTGREVLYLGRRAFSYAVGLELDESEELLEQLWGHATQQKFAWCHEWRVGDVIVWDNRCVLHRREPFDNSFQRVMHRTQFMGEQFS